MPSFRRPPARREFTSTSRSCAARCRRRSGRSRKSSPSRSRAAHPEADHGRIPDREAAGGTRARRLQPERLGTHAGVDLFGPPEAAGGGLDAGDVGRDGARHPHRRLPNRQRARARAEARRLWNPLTLARGPAVWTWSASYECLAGDELISDLHSCGPIPAPAATSPLCWRSSRSCIA